MSPEENRASHPEDFCQRCGGRNRAWVVPSDRFNTSAKALGLDRGAILCPVCFMEGHRLATGLSCTWELVPATPFRWLEQKQAVKIAGNWREVDE